MFTVAVDHNRWPKGRRVSTPLNLVDIWLSEHSVLVKVLFLHSQNILFSIYIIEGWHTQLALLLYMIWPGLLSHPLIETERRVLALLCFWQRNIRSMYNKREQERSPLHENRISTKTLLISQWYHDIVLNIVLGYHRWWCGGYWVDGIPWYTGRLIWITIVN